MKAMRAWGGVVLLLVVFAAMYLVGQATRSEDDGLGGAGSDLTPSATQPAGSTASASPSTGSSPAASATLPSAWQDLDPYDLEFDETVGGHTIARHVGRTDAQLAQRLKDEPDISAASTYTNLALAELAVAAALDANQSRVTDWENRTGERANLVLRYEAPVVVGRTHDRDEDAPTNSEDVVVVLRWTGKEWFVLTSYPEDR